MPLVVSNYRYPRNTLRNQVYPNIHKLNINNSMSQMHFTPLARTVMIKILNEYDELPRYNLSLSGELLSTYHG